VNLSDEQRAAVTRTGQDVCVVAGPGSGKTRVLVARFAWRVAHGCSPLRLLAVTFTDKAAAEMKQRLAEQFAARPELREQLERAPVSTLHSFCARLLKEHAVAAGLDPEFQVLEQLEADEELHAAAEETLDALLAERPAEMRGLLAAVDFAQYEPAGALARVFEARRLLQSAAPPAVHSGNALERLRACMEEILAASPAAGTERQREGLAQVQAWCRRALAAPPGAPPLEMLRLLADLRCDLGRIKAGPVREAARELRESLAPAAHQALIGEYYAPQRALLEEALMRLETRYRARKQALRALDFADLEEHAIRLLRGNPELRARVAESFDEILMDELQDTNPLQAVLLELLRRPDRFFAVGDINQSIYGFRHAEPEIFRRYRDALQAQGRAVDRLTENYRSRREILEAVETIVGGEPGIEPHHLTAKGEFAAADGHPVEVIAAVADTSGEAAALEAQWVARRIRELADGGAARFSDMAILVRNVNALPPFEAALRDFDVPYVVARGKGFYEAQEIADLTHWLRVLACPRDEIALAGLLRSPLVGVSDETLLRLKEHGHLADALERAEQLAGIEAEERRRLAWLRGQLHAQSAERDEVAPDRLLARILDASGYEDTLSPRARANVRRFLEVVRDWFARRPRPLAELIEELAGRRLADPDEAAPPLEGALNAVRVMTMHAAKGLEFPVVFAAALHKGVSNDSPPLAYSPAAGVVARWRDPVTRKGVKDAAYTQFSEEWARKQAEEASRLLYVAMTRAIDRLVLSLAATPKEVRNWAGLVVSRLGVDLDEAHTEPPERPGPRAPETIVEGEERLARPVLTGQHDASVAVTSIDMFQECPRKYFLARYLGWEAPHSVTEPRPQEAAARPLPLVAAQNGRATVSEARPSGSAGLDASVLGTQVHDLLAGLDVPDAAPEALELAARFRASDLGRRAAAASRAEREFDFLFEAEGLLLEGRIDLWFEEGGELVLVDYKTDDVTGAEAPARAALYAPQLQLYALAIERAAGRRPDQAFVYLLRPDVAVPVSLRAEDIEAARAAVRALRQAQEELRFPPCPGAPCRRCAYLGSLCPAGKM
jgi:ATP-dependent exoDNAse (exonuclease V) beta subunit